MEDDIRKLAEDIGSGELQEQVALELIEGRPRSARIYILAYLDSAISNGDMNDVEAGGFYQRLGFTTDEMSQIRQRAKSPMMDSPRQRH